MLVFGVDISVKVLVIFIYIAGDSFVLNVSLLPSPRYTLDDIGSGSHVHLSLWENGVNVFTGVAGSSHGMSKIGEEFMAGVLFHLPAILAFTAPNPNR